MADQRDELSGPGGAPVAVDAPRYHHVDSEEQAREILKILVDIGAFDNMAGVDDA
jgi:hypothetical protein